MCTNDECRFMLNFNNAQRGSTILKLVSNFTISKLRSIISKLHKFANCMEHIHVHVK